LKGFNLKLRNILKRPQKKQPDEKRPEGFLDPEDEKACEVVRGAFNLLFEGSGVRIFTASHLDLSHRWVPFLGKSDIVIFSDPWALREKIAIKTQECARFPENLYFLCNDWQTYYVRKPHIKNLHVINQNCFMDESIFCIKDKFEKKYDVLYNGRRSKTKRHYLAKNVGEELKLALVYPHYDLSWSDLPEDELPRHVYHNKVGLSPQQVCDVINQSRVGLILSAREGACFASSEYLLCGVPVISTPSKGGRAFWYNDENSLIVDPDPAAVLDAARALIAAPRDPHRIRAAHLKLIQEQRQALLDNVLRPIRDRFSLDWDYHFSSCNLMAEFALRKDCWMDLASICRRLRGS
jgi:glycosyltransferase involved in cell wall biosynthesis